MPPVEVLWWNVQRCFAPIASRISTELDSAPDDGWTPAVYHRKLDNVAAILRHALAGRTPGIIALCEVENSRVVEDLRLRLGFDDLVEAVGDDDRLEAHDVVVLYARSQFTQVGVARSYNIHNRFRTRDILELTLRARDGTELLVVANHWPSRMIANAAALRIGLADHTRRIVESWLRFGWDELHGVDGPALPDRTQLTARWNRPGIVLGDFNDEPFDASVASVLGAQRRRDLAARAPEFPRSPDFAGVKRYLSIHARLYNPSWALLTAADGPSGTLLWDGDWYLLDQILFTPGMLGDGAIRYVADSLRIVVPPAITTAAGDPIRALTDSHTPRSFTAAQLDGVSDHLLLASTIDVP